MSKKPEVTAPVARQLSIQAVIDVFLERGSISRARLSEVTGLSKQTMSEVVRELVSQGWIKEGEQVTGGVGRRALNYEFQEGACYVLGIDLGGATFRAAFVTLNGKISLEMSEETDPRGGIYVIEQIASVVERMIASSGINKRSIQVGVIAVSGVFQTSTGAVLAASNISGINNIDFAGMLTERIGVPLLVENAVDMATRGERWHGSVKGVDNFIFVAHGAGIGLGAVVGGMLLKGRRGAIGEIALLPIGANPFDSRNFDVGTLESEVGAQAIVRKYECYGGARGASVRDIFGALDDGSEPAEMVIDETARLVALAIASSAAVLDPEVVVMGGQIGVHPALISRVERHLKRCTPLRLQLEPTSLGPRAQLVGALGAGIDFAYERLFGVAASGHPRRVL
ncbi:ROK family transcriptional regulator [Hoeflea sp. G2-23]|uniref:ROK family transcriptional regulator n=1 Tax=Hoeflea algicola TaxID=2983763 RepID=A0ABT3ZFL3_9HYPH|nr:ROK family transcriptional regulator [Hoeflea algicola]MCY0150406.1 ROK family transcriptional regulator [Hoeflea algicola]